MIVLENKSTYLLVFFDILCMLYHLSLSRYKVGQTQKLGEVVNNTISHDAILCRHVHAKNNENLLPQVIAAGSNVVDVFDSQCIIALNERCDFALVCSRGQAKADDRWEGNKNHRLMLHNLDIVLKKVLISDYIDWIFRRRHKKIRQQRHDRRSAGHWFV